MKFRWIPLCIRAFTCNDHDRSHKIYMVNRFAHILWGIRQTQIDFNQYHPDCIWAISWSPLEFTLPDSFYNHPEDNSKNLIQELFHKIQIFRSSAHFGDIFKKRFLVPPFHFLELKFYTFLKMYFCHTENFFSKILWIWKYIILDRFVIRTKWHLLQNDREIRLSESVLKETLVSYWSFSHIGWIQRFFNCLKQ